MKIRDLFRTWRKRWRNRPRVRVSFTFDMWTERPVDPDDVALEDGQELTIRNGQMTMTKRRIAPPDLS